MWESLCVALAGKSLVILWELQVVFWLKSLNTECALTKEEFNIEKKPLEGAIMESLVAKCDCFIATKRRFAVMTSPSRLKRAPAH